MPARRSEPKLALTERAIVNAALELLAEKGVAGLTMRELSARLGVALGATYRHVRSKHDLLKLVTLELYERIEPGDPVADGFAQARDVMVQVHDLVGAYPGLAGYIGQHMSDFSSLSLSKSIIDPLCAAGLSDRDAQGLLMSLILFNSGHLLVRDSLPWSERTGTSDVFGYGLDLLLDGGRRRVRKPLRRRERR